MSLKEEIFKQLTLATKQRDALRLSTLRLLRAGIKNREVELKRGLNDEEVLRVIQGEIRQRKESIRQFTEAGRNDLASNEEKELAVLMSFMPEQLSTEAIEKMVTGVIQEIGAKDMKDMGRVMKTVMGKLAGSADGKAVNEIVKKHLAN